MTSRDDDRPTADTTPTSLTKPRPRPHRARVAAGVAGLAAILGGGAYMATSAIIADKSTTSTDVSAQQMPTGSAPDPAVASPDSGANGSTTKNTQLPTTDVSGSPIPSKIVEEVRKAREKMARDGVKVRRPVPRQQPETPPEQIERKTTGTVKDGQVRVVAALGDLTGQAELRYVAGGITEYRDAQCSQTFKFASSPQPAKKANLLMCWRTSAQKSVVAMVVDPEGKPSKNKAVKALEKKWRSMG
jgi:hypothetical protein